MQKQARPDPRKARMLQWRWCACGNPYDIHANSRSLRSQLGYSCGDIVQFQLSSTMSQNSSQQKLVSCHSAKPLFPLLAVELLALCIRPVSITSLSAAAAVETCAENPVSPAAVLFFLGAPFPLLFAICRCSKRSSSNSLYVSKPGYSLCRSLKVATRRG